MKHSTTIALAVAAMTGAYAAPAAASDVHLTIEGIKGEAKGGITVESWSFGVCNVGQCSTSSTKREGAVTTDDDGERVQAGLSQGAGAVAQGAAMAGKSKGNWNIKKAEGARSAGKVNVAAGDLDGDGAPDLAYAATQDEVYGLALTFHKIPAEYLAACESGHIDQATLETGGEALAVSSVSVLCTKGGGMTSSSYARSGINTINSMPNRISMNMTVPKQTQGATFGEKVQSGLATAGTMTMTLTGGQMKHTKTGHVTLLK